MESKKIVVLSGHPDSESFTKEILEQYKVAAEEVGHEIKMFNISEMNFDPILHKGYKEIQHLEEDLQIFQDAVKECDHLVIGYPNWWCGMPALLKGLFDRVWLPGFAFNIDKRTRKVEKHLTGKTARVFILSGTYGPTKTWWKFGDYTNEIQYGILDFAGIKTQVTAYGPVEYVDDVTRNKWIEGVKKIGKLAK